MDADVTNLHDLTWAYRAARVLQVANNLGIFTALSEKCLPAQQISAAVDGKLDMIHKLLIACTAMGLLQETAGEYKNTEFAQKYLVSGRPLYQGNIIAHAASVWNFWTGLEEQMVLDAARQCGKRDEHRDFIMGMHNIAVAGRVEIFINSVDLSGRKRLFDVGGGPGTYSIVACKRYPQLTAVVFDLPETLTITRELIAAERLQDRVSVQQGNWDTDDFAEGNDVVLFSNVLHGPSSNAQVKLSKAYDSLIDGGLLVIQEFLLNDEKTGPLIPALFNIMVGAYSANELLSIIEKQRFLEPGVVASCDEIGSSWITARKQ